VVGFDYLFCYDLILTTSHWQAILSKLLTYSVLRSTQPPTLRGMGNA